MEGKYYLFPFGGKKPFHVILVVCVASDMWGNYIAVEQAGMGILIFKTQFIRIKS